MQGKSMRLTRLAPVIAASLLAAAAGTAAAQEHYKIGYVSTERVMRESRVWQQAQKEMEAEFGKRDQEIARGPQGDIERRRRALVEDMNHQREQAMQQNIDKANAAIKRIAEAEHFDAVFLEASYAAPRIDLTDKVIKALDAAR